MRVRAEERGSAAENIKIILAEEPMLMPGGSDPARRGHYLYRYIVQVGGPHPVDIYVPIRVPEDVPEGRINAAAVDSLRQLLAAIAHCAERAL